MAVYILNNMTIHDRAEYDRYLRAFLGVFRKYQGEILAAVDAPAPVEGEWPTTGPSCCASRAGRRPCAGRSRRSTARSPSTARTARAATW